ncbi:MAG: MFS transporter [Thermoleophilia bacterium]
MNEPEQPKARGRLTGRALRNVRLLAVCQALGMTANSLVLSTSALVGVALAPRASLTTLPIAIQFLATMASTIPASLLMGRIGRRGGFLVGAGMGIVSSVIAAVAILQGRFVLFCFAAVFVGAFNAFGNYYRFAAVDTAGAAFAGRAVSYVLAGGVVAAFAGPNLAAVTRTVIPSVEFAASYLAVIAVYLAVFFTVLLVNIPRPERAVAAETPRPLRVVAAQPAFLVALVAGMLGYGVMSLVMTATPLAMRAGQYSFGSTAFVIQWHVVGMFAPSFVTGRLIARFGVSRIMLVGALLETACVAVNLTGEGMGQYWASLVLLGIGWNFLFIGATTMLTGTHTDAEKSRAQALNDFLIFTTVTLASLSAGVLQATLGWRAVNLGVLPLVLVILGSLAWYRRLAGRDAGTPATRA